MKATRLVTRIDEAELAVRMCEANYRIVRPAHLDAKQALQAMDDDVREGWRRSAQAALFYLAECMEHGMTTVEDEGAADGRRGD